MKIQNAGSSHSEMAVEVDSTSAFLNLLIRTGMATAASLTILQRLERIAKDRPGVYSTLPLSTELHKLKMSVTDDGSDHGGIAHANFSDTDADLSRNIYLLRRKTRAVRGAASII